MIFSLLEPDAAELDTAEVYVTSCLSLKYQEFSGPPSSDCSAARLQIRLQKRAVIVTPGFVCQAPDSWFSVKLLKTINLTSVEEKTVFIVCVCVCVCVC